jgi:hypothetical protein
MSREIKFRAWDGEKMSDCNEWQVTALSMPNVCGYIAVMQYTGLNDKNGVEIYEGDLLIDPQGNVGRVFYSDKSASYLINWKRKDGTWDTDSCFGYGKVIGNIYENPELLNGAGDG